MKKTPALELIQGGLEDQPVPKPDPKEPTPPDWLSPMASGTEFKCKDKTGRTPRWLVVEYTHCGKLLGDVLLSPTVTLNDPRSWFWVDPVVFCREWEYRGTIEVPERKEDEPE